jgi:hypothetical protein
LSYDAPDETIRGAFEPFGMEGEVRMKKLKGKIVKIRVDYHAKDGLKQEDLVEIWDHWKEDLFEGKTFLGKRTKIKVRSLEPPYVEKDIDENDVIIRD